MVPVTWVSALLFLLFIVPGLVFDILGDRRRSLAESTFREISRVALASTVFSGASIVILVAVAQLWNPSWLISPSRLANEGPEYLARMIFPLIWTIASATTASVLLAALAHKVIARFQGGAPIRQRSAWTRVFSHDRPKGAYPYARARLNDGTIYSGRIQDYSSDMEIEDRELVLMPPWLRVKHGDKGWVDAPEDIERIILRGSEIRAISVTYWPIERGDIDKTSSGNTAELAEGPQGSESL